MSITTFTELLTAMDNWLSHSLYDTNRKTEMVGLFESAANRRMRVREMVTSTNLTPSNGTCTMPSDYLAYKRVTRLSTIPQDLEFMDDAFLQIVYPDQVSTIYPTPRSVPSAYFTIEGSSMFVRPKDDGSQIQLVYYQRIPALATNTANWLITTHPDLYLFGSLCEAVAYGVDDNRFALWKARRDELFQEIEDSNESGETGTGAQRAQGPTP